MKLILVREQSLKSSDGRMDGARTDIYSAETATELVEQIYHWSGEWFWYDKDSPLKILESSLKGNDCQSITTNHDCENLSDREFFEDDFWFEAQVGDAPRHFLSTNLPEANCVNLYVVSYGAVSTSSCAEATGVHNRAVAQAISVLEAGDDWLSVASNTLKDRNEFTENEYSVIRAYSLGFVEPSEYPNSRRLAWLVLRDFFVGLKRDVSGLNLSEFTKVELMEMDWSKVKFDEHTKFPEDVASLADFITT